ncbi:MAG: hypothetical protein LBD23_10090 [Oscillospiraceae bacterium]|jgi:hypothetical protein|nr:hypothetical protein [Oscillospiraceae bacterium]
MPNQIKTPLKPRFKDDERDFFLSVIPKDIYTLTIILAKKAYALFKAYQSEYSEKCTKFKEHTDYIIHDKIICEWFADNKEDIEKMKATGNSLKIRVVDDTLLHGNSLRNCLEILRAFDYGAESVDVYVFAVNEQLARKNHVDEINNSKHCKRKLLYLNEKEQNIEDFLFCGELENCYDNCFDSTKYETEIPYNIYYYKKCSRSTSRRQSRMNLELIHTESVPYITNMPIYSLSFDEAGEYLFETQEFRDENKLIETPFRCASADRYSFGSSFDTSMINKVSSLCAVLTDGKGNSKTLFNYEQTAMVRILVNYELMRVLVVPYSIFKPCYSSASTIDDFPEETRVLMNPVDKQDDTYDIIMMENHKTFIRLLQYGRALELAKELFGEHYEAVTAMCFLPQPVLSEMSSSIAALWEKAKATLLTNEMFRWDEKERRFADKTAKTKLRKYNIPEFFFKVTGIHKQSYDLYFDSISNIYQRTRGISSADFLADLLERTRRYYNDPVSQSQDYFVNAFFAALCDRGVGISSIGARKVKNGYAVGSRLCDGEMTSEAYAKVEGLEYLPLVVFTIHRECPSQEQWGKTIKQSLKNRITEKLSNPSLTRFVDDIFKKVTMYEYGDYLIHNEEYYDYNKDDLTSEQRLFAEIEHEFIAKMYPEATKPIKN